MEDYEATLDAYQTNPLSSGSPAVGGKYKDDLDSFKAWYTSRGDEYKVDMSKAGKDSNGFYLYPESSKRYTLNSDNSGFDKK